MADKAVFIGLGGSGVSAAAHLKAKLWKEYSGKGKLRDRFRFIFIDTASDRVERMNEVYRGHFGSEPLIPDVERVNLGTVNPNAIYLTARSKEKAGSASLKQKHLLSFIDERGAIEFKATRLEDGASGNRQQGRVAVWEKMGEAQSKISEVVQELRNISNDDGQDNTLSFYILSGTCGGTGSSSFLDVAYILDREVKMHIKEGDPKIRAVLFMPQWYVQQQRGGMAPERIVSNYESNAFAFFDEIDYFLEDYYSGIEEGKGVKYRHVFVDPTIDRGIEYFNERWSLFNFALLIDSTTEQGAVMTDEQMYQNTAELLYYWHQGHTHGSMVADMDNHLTNAYYNSRPVPAYMTMGYRALQFPEKLMRDYFVRRFLYELFNFGLVGKPYTAAYPDEEARQAEQRSILRQGITRYLFADEREEGVPNLEDTRQTIIERYLQSMTVGQFKRGDESWLGRGRGEYDPEKIANSEQLRRLIELADTLIVNIRNEMSESFRSSDDPTGSEKLMRAMRFGTQTEEGRARTGSLERFLEEGILRFGLDYSVQLADRLDVEASGLVNQLRNEKMELQDRMSLLESEIASAERGCLEGKQRERVRHFTALFSKLQEKIRLAGRDATLTQQIALLNDLSEGDSGVLDHYRKNLSVLKTAVQERLEGKVEPGSAEPNLKDGFNVNLPKEFQATAEDVTTTYLPDVKTFVMEGQWAPDHRFAQLYAQLVKQVQTKGGGTEPQRHRPEDYGKGAATQGLHHALRRILTDPEITELANGYEHRGEIVFFRDFFTIEKRQPAQAMLNRVEQYARKYIVRLMRDSRDVMSEIQKPLNERVDDLSPEEREALKTKFNSGTQTFCKMSTVGGGQATTYNLYVGSDQSLAVKMGFSPGSASQFVPADVPNRFLSIRAKTLWTIDQYPYHERYSQIYAATRKERQEKRSTFAPHIHRLFNLHGVADGMRMLVQPESTELTGLFVKALLYREMFEGAKQQKLDDLLGELFYLNERLAGDRETCYSPLIIQAGVNSGKEALVCGTLKRSNGRLLLERGSFINVAGDVKYHSDIFAGLSGKPQLVASLQEVDDFFHENCSRSWLQILEDSYVSLREKLMPKSTWSGETREFYINLSNALHDIYEPLKSLVSGKQKRTDTSTPENGGQVKPDEGAVF